ncbi:MAG: diguanylate cyclase [Nannocystaceae bacterium]|nr:sensor domain-containing diguanylate cyclase [bacterium]
MSALARSLYGMRRQASGRWPVLVLLIVWPMLWTGALDGTALWQARLPQVSAVALLTAALVWSVMREVSGARSSAERSGAAELELGLLLVTGVFVLLAATGGARSFLYPLAYAVVSFLLVVHRHRGVAAVLLLAAGALELALGYNAGFEGAWTLTAYHLTFLGFFAAGNMLVLSTLVRRLRRTHATEVENSLAQMRQEARDFRLIGSSLPPQSRSRSRDEEELRMAHAAVEGIHEQLFHTLELLRTSMRLRSCVLLWCEQSGTSKVSARNPPKLVVKEMATHSEYAVEDRVLGGPGLLTSLIADPKEVRLRALKGKRLPPYYQGPEPITDLCALPLLEGASLRGILCADRTGDEPFTDEESAVLQRAADHIRRVIEHERVFAAVERSKYEQEQFYRASEMLSEALTLEQVYEKTFAAVRAIASYDLAVVSAVGPGGEHEALAVDADAQDADFAELAASLRGHRWSDARSLVSMAVKNRHYMPATGELADPDGPLFGAGMKLPKAKSIIVLPLLRGEQVLGAITFVARRQAVFPSATREMLRVIGQHVAVSLQNARMYQSMETRATTDGLTGLTNHRAFQERLAQIHALAERTGQKYSVILTDIDHFKSINDTYGHPVGDQVLKRVASIFTGRARKVDTVARYGGEEFVLVLPDTDGKGAEQLANKLREEIGDQVMTSEHGTFKITISMGVAEFPLDGKDRLGLVEKADQALYYCKEHGRNCVRRWAEGA